MVLDRVATHILLLKIRTFFFDGNFSEYELDRVARLGDTPKGQKYRKLEKARSVKSDLNKATPGEFRGYDLLKAVREWSLHLYSELCSCWNLSKRLALCTSTLRSTTGTKLVPVTVVNITVTAPLKSSDVVRFGYGIHHVTVVNRNS